MSEASQKDVETQGMLSPRTINPFSEQGGASGLKMPEGKHRGNLANLTMTNYSNMVSKEKDKYIEKLRRRNLLAKEKIQQLENSNADFWKTIQQQQDLLESLEKKLDEQETKFKNEMRFLRSKKNESIRKLKQMLSKERGEKVKDEPESPSKTPVINMKELEDLKKENSRLEAEVQRLTNLVDSMSQNGATKSPLNEEEDIKRKLEETEVELRAVQEELTLAKSVPASPEVGVLDGRNELDNELDKINLLKESEVTKNFLSEEMRKSAQVQEELWLMGLELEELKREKMQLGALLREKELNMDQQLHEALRESEKRFRKELNIREGEIKQHFENELSEAKRKAEKKAKEAEEYALACETLSKQLAEKRGEGNKADSNHHDLMEEAENEKMKHQQAYDTLVKEVATLKSEREWIRDSKISTISSLSIELERLRRHTSLTMVV